MTEIQSGSKTLSYVNYKGNSQLDKAFIEGRDVKASGVFGRPAKSKCKSGSSFEYMLIFYNLNTNDAAIETCYVSS